MLTLRMCLSTEMNAKISAAIYTIRAFPTAPLCYMKLNGQVFNKEVATKIIYLVWTEHLEKVPY